MAGDQARPCRSSKRVQVGTGLTLQKSTGLRTPPNNIQMEPARLMVHAIMSRGRAAHSARSASSRVKKDKMRIVIFGNSGSGKSTMARDLSERHQIPMLELDTVVWEPGKIAVLRPRAEVRGDAGEVVG